jgi:hypothetical protein
MAGCSSAARTTCQSRPGSGVLSFVSSFSVRRGFLVPALSISAPILLDTLGACPLVCGAGAVRRLGPWSFAPSCRGAARLSRIAE